MDGKNLNTNYLERQRKEHLTRDKPERVKESVNVIVQTRYRVQQRNKGMTNFKTIVSLIHFK